MKLLLITGGSKGLGLALCEQFKRNGYQVTEFSRSAPHEFSVSVDLTNPEMSRLAVAKAIAPIDINQLEELVVINNAGTLVPIGQTSEKDATDLLNSMNTNFVSAILVLTEIITKFQPATCKKIIANISSGAALKGYYGWSLYCAAKAGTENFICSLAVEQQTLSHPFLPINIDPGVIDTDMQALIRATPQSDFVEVERFIQRKNQGLLVPPDKVAESIFNIITLPSLSFGNRYETSKYTN
ncbi:MAG: SDR family NAD(P)-dependent oxidoreductase [Anaerolineales bacterium]